MQRQKTLEFWVGIFVILGFAALLFMALAFLKKMRT